MCGLTALISTGAPLAPRALVEMTDLVRHRGPDGDGYVAFGGAELAPHPFGGRDTPAQCFTASHPFLPASANLPAAADLRVLLGHRRLAIVELSPLGYQPMCTPERDLWIVYNGEVYNHVELRRELEGRGHRFASHSDTEVMLAAYREWGAGCMERFNGMFAFVLLDRRKRVVLAARDRFGVKPLYLYRSAHGAHAFASEIKQFSALEGWRASLNGQRAYDYLAWGACDHTAETLFDGVRQLRGGEAMQLDLASGEAKTWRWYELKPRAGAMTRADAAREFRELLTDSVRLRLRADVPVGSCLSGGLDSSSIVCVANGLLRESGAQPMQKTFSAVTDSPRYDERRYAEAVVGKTGVEATWVAPSPGGLFDEMDALTWHQDEPFGSTSVYAQWAVFRAAAAGRVRVMLDGQGADEALGGYPAFFGARLASLARQLRVPSFAAEASAMRAVHGIPMGSLMRQAAASLAPGWLRALARRGHASDWIDVGRLGAQAGHPYEQGGNWRGSMRALSTSQLLASSLPMLLHWEDRDSMAHSIEARVPFLDYRLVEFLLGLADELKIERGMTKAVLREGMRDVLPEAVRSRTDKLGFQMPEEEWMRADASRFREAFARSLEAAAGLVRPGARRWLEDMITGRSGFSFVSWRIIAFGAWLRRFGVRVPA